MYPVQMIKMYMTNLIRRKYKQCILFVCCMIIPYVLVISIRYGLVKWFYSKTVNSSVHLQYVTVHFDLKGSPPKINYLLSLLPTLKMYGVNSILMEYEDMFPFEDSIVNLSASYHYTKDELMMFIKRAKHHKMEIIPLIQTHGHMEYALKLKEFAHLREKSTQPAEICPSNELSTILITTMLKQVIKFHASIMPLKHIHIGCDEVFTINICPRCRNKNLTVTELFMNHVRNVSAIVTKLSPHTKVLIWSDMVVNPKKLVKYDVYDNVEPVWWDYTTKKISHTYAYDLHLQFNNIWIASAFKGADGPKATIPIIRHRFENHLNWMRFILNYKFGGENKVFNFKGIILTGWSRYTHMSVQCELLPIAMPSLILNLMLIRTLKEGIHSGDLHKMETCEFFDKYLKTEFETIFQTSEVRGVECSFENTKLYKEHTKTFNFDLNSYCMSALRTFEMFSMFNGYIDVYALKKDLGNCRNILRHLEKMKKNMRSFMTRYYKTEVINSYLDEIINVPNAEINRLMKYLEKQTKVNYWDRRQ